MCQSNLPVPINQQTFFINKYRLIERLGAGNFGEVFLAHDEAVKSDYAVKILMNSVNITEDLKEAIVGHKLKHKNLVHIYQADVSCEGKIVIAMEYLRQGTITKYVNARRFMPLKSVLKLSQEILKGLEYLHGKGILHNDIKPDNILLGDDGEAKLSDYGVAVPLDHGTPSKFYSLHISPEALEGKNIDVRTDIYQFGLTMFRLLTGADTLSDKCNKLGEEGYKEAVLKGTLITKADFPAFIPNSVRRIILKAIHSAPDERFQTALEMRRELEKLSFPGEWTVDDKEKFWGEDSRNKYDFEETEVEGLFQFAAFKTNKASGKRTKIHKFTKKDMKKKEYTKLKDKFMGDVVKGKLT